MEPVKWFFGLFLLASPALVIEFHGLETQIITKDAVEDSEDTIYSESESDEVDDTLPKWSLTSSEEDFGLCEEWLTWSTLVNVPSFNLTNTTIGMLRKLGKFGNTEGRPSTISSLFDNSEEGILAILLKFEIFTKASGRNFLLPEVEDKNSSVSLRSIASAITNLWLRLKSGEKVEHTLNLILRRAATAHTESGKNLTKKVLEDLLRKVLQAFDTLMPRKHSEFFRTYNESLRTKVAHFPNNKAYIPFNRLRRGKLDVNKVRRWLTDKNTAAFLIHQQLLDAVTRRDNDTEIDELMQLVLEVANKNDNFANVCQHNYVEALKIEAKHFKPDEFPRRTMRTFVNQVDLALTMDPGMEDKWPSMKRKRLVAFWNQSSAHNVGDKGKISPRRE